jgi:hypothetical protein
VVDVPKVHARGVGVIAARVVYPNGAPRQPVQKGVLMGGRVSDGSLANEGDEPFIPNQISQTYIKGRGTLRKGGWQGGEMGRRAM